MHPFGWELKGILVTLPEILKTMQKMKIFKHSFTALCAMLATVALLFTSCDNDDEDNQLRVELKNAPTTAYFDYGQTHSFEVSMKKEHSYEIEEVPDGWKAEMPSKTLLKVTAPAKGSGTMTGTVKISVHRKERTVSAQLKVEILPATTITQTANSYILSEPNARYKIKATVKGNSSQSIGGTPATATIIWQTSKNLLKSVMLDGDHISITTTADANDESKINKGNALVAVKDADENILWSWHLWMTDYNPNEENITYPDGSVMMDRNLGAKSNGSDDAYNAYGLFYQWGRKEPLIMSDDATSTSNASTYGPLNTNVAFSTTDSDKETGNIAYTTKFPLRIIKGVEATGYDWLFSNHDTSLWAANKTMYDPCPAGWRVPESKVWAGLAEVTDKVFEGGWYFNIDGQVTFYPAAGRRSFSKGMLTNVNHDGTPYTGYYWSVNSAANDKSVGLYFNINGIETAQANYRAGGFQIRCVKE